MAAGLHVSILFSFDETPLRKMKKVQLLFAFGLLSVRLSAFGGEELAVRRATYGTRSVQEGSWSTLQRGPGASTRRTREVMR